MDPILATDSTMPQPMAQPWYLYMLECIDGSIYTGITVDVQARYTQHACGKGARYTRAHPPKRLLFTLELPDHSSALQAEYSVKRLSKVAKMALVNLLEKVT